SGDRAAWVVTPCSKALPSQRRHGYAPPSCRALACARGMSMDLARLPSLELIRGFVAVGRRMSMTLAAADLSLTQSAVSRQVHALEEQLGVRLLIRGHRSIAFTPEGERLFRSANGAVQQLQDVV